MADELKMKEAPKAAWCAMLNEPGLLQVTGKLYGEITPAERRHAWPGSAACGYGYCCLGVFARSQGASFEFEQVIEQGEDGDVEGVADEATVTLPNHDGDINESELLEEDWADQFGITSAHQAFLSTLNDGGQSTVKRDDPFFPLYQKYCKSEGAPDFPDSVGVDRRLFTMRKHTFAEISAIISEEF